MRYPMLKSLPRVRQTVSTFYGCDRRPQARPGAFRDMRNLTSDAFPLMQVRADRKKYYRGISAGGQETELVISPDSALTAAAVVNGSVALASEQKLYYHGNTVDGAPMDPLASGRRIVPFGRNFFVSPDGKYLETDETGVTKVRHAAFSQALPGAVIGYADENGQTVTVADPAPTPPNNPAEGTVWTDTSGDTWIRKSYTDGAWAEVCRVYLKLSHPYAGRFAVPDDRLELHGIGNIVIPATAAIVLSEALLLRCSLVTVPAGTYLLTLKKTMPALDLAIEHDNRIWGCRFGRNAAGAFVNEIYASALGDPTVWDKFDGTATDSYAVALGCPGPFTGVAAVGGEVLFFKEHFLIRVCGGTPQDYTVQVTPAPGPAAGNENTVATLRQKVYYLAGDGVYVYDGALPYAVSQELFLRGLTDTRAAAWNGKYYLAAEEEGERRIYVYDPSVGLWHVEDDERNVRFFITLDAGLFLLCPADVQGSYAFTVIGADGAAPNVINPADGTPVCRYEALPQKTWLAETGRLTPSDATGVVRGVVFRLMLGENAEFRAEIACGDGPWTPLCRVRRPAGDAFTVPVNTPRCVSLRLRLSGTGDCTLYGITLVTERTGEVKNLVR